MKVAVSYLGQRNIASFINRIDKTDVDYIHVDVMDGKYVKQKTISYKELSSIVHYTNKRLDVHFMVSKPLKYIDNYANLNVSYMSFHLDTKDKIEDIIQRTKLYGIKVGIVLNPNDSIDKVFPYLENIDLVLIMTVNPGLPGQTLIEEVVPKIFALKKEIKMRQLNVLVSVDGGINLENKSLLKGSDILVCGSCISKSDNYQETINELRKI